ncbi:hypothetical protein PAMP_009296 [Pampus punctatissimus]
MFTSQASSFQDSIDVEEKDDFDSEEIAGYSQKIQLNCYYTIYLYQGTSLTLIDSSLPLEAEPELRTYISRRLSKGALLGGMGNIATVELRIIIIIVLGGTTDGGWSQFYPVLFHLSSNMKLLKNKSLEMDKINELVNTCVDYLLLPALSHTHVEVINSDERTKADVSRFIKAASLQGLSQQDTTTASLCKAISEDIHSDLTIDCSTSPPTLTNTVSNRFCDDWIQAFLNAAERCNPFLLRQILENFKLKAIQDMNSLKRFVRQAEMSHYALFRCCQFLQGCGNGDVLLQNARVEHSDLPEACSIIGVLEEFLRDQAQAQAQA